MFVDFFFNVRKQEQDVREQWGTAVTHMDRGGLEPCPCSGLCLTRAGATVQVLFPYCLSHGIIVLASEMTPLKRVVGVL